MIAADSERPSIRARHGRARAGPPALDSTVTLEINGTRQQVRLCGARRGLPPLLIVQAGPGLPLLNEVARLQNLLELEHDFSVAYWDQRGCGRAAQSDARGLSLETQIDDAGAVLRWLRGNVGGPVVVLGISLGATIALQVAVRDPSDIQALVAVSIDTDTSASDIAADAFLRAAGTEAGRRHLARSMQKLGAPPYTTPGPLQARARLMADRGGVEHGRRFGPLLRGLLLSLVRTYGWSGAVTALRNMNAVQRELLPEVATLNLFANWPRPAMAVHYIFGRNDPLMPQSLVDRIMGVIGHGDTLVTVPNAGHMVHFDEPALVRSTVVRAHGTM